MNTSIERDHLDDSPSETVRRHAATFRKVREARRASSASASEELSDEHAHRAPMEPMREALSDEIPRNAGKVAQAARAAGWAVRVVYSRGADGTEALSVRCRRGGEAAVGYWRAGRFAWALHDEPSDGLRKIGARELKAALAGEVVSDEDR